MIFTDEETAMIEGIIGSFFSGSHASEDVRFAYARVMQHMADDTLDAVDYRLISNAADLRSKTDFANPAAERGSVS